MTGSPQDDQSKLFDNYAGEYAEAVNRSIHASGESVGFFSRLKAELVVQDLDGRPLRTLLDFGCGTGLGTQSLANALGASVRLTGVDPSAASLDVARSRHLPNAEFVPAAEDRLAFDDGAFDAIFAACVFHHIDRERHKAWMSELARVLAPGGRVWIFEHNPYNPLTVRTVRACEFDEGVTLLRPGYTRSLVGASGLSASSPHFYFFLPHALASLRPAERYLRRIPLGAQYYVRGVKQAPSG